MRVTAAYITAKITVVTALTANLIPQSMMKAKNPTVQHEKWIIFFAMGEILSTLVSVLPRDIMYAYAKIQKDMQTDKKLASYISQLTEKIKHA